MAVGEASHTIKVSIVDEVFLATGIILSTSSLTLEMRARRKGSSHQRALYGVVVIHTSSPLCQRCVQSSKRRYLVLMRHQAAVAADIVAVQSGFTANPLEDDQHLRGGAATAAAVLASHCSRWFARRHQVLGRMEQEVGPQSLMLLAVHVTRGLCEAEDARDARACGSTCTRRRHHPLLSTTV